MKLDGFIGPSYTLEKPSANSQRALNIYPEIQEAGPRKGNVLRFKGTPGLRKRVTLGDGPIRGVYWTSTGQLLVVSGANLYEVTSDWSSSLRSGFLNTSTGHVTMVDDGTRVMIGDGSPTAYNANLAFGSAVSVVADADCPGGQVAWLDGYFINTVPDTNQFQISGNDAVTYDPLDVASAEGRPDNMEMVISVNRQLWFFKDQTTEVWWDSGDATFPFQRIDAAFIETGTVSSGTCVRVASSVAWVGNDERGRGTVWFAQGFQPTRISTHAIELALAGYANLDQACAFAYQQGGHEFYQLSVPASDTDGGGTWVFDFSTKQWHERSYLGVDGAEPHRASCGTVGFGEVVVGDREDGRLYTYDLDYNLDDTTPIRRMRQSPHVSQAEKRIKFNSFELHCEPGVGVPTGQGSSPIILLSWSDDGGHTWSNEHEASMGAEGQYKTRIKWRRLGVSRDRVFRVATSEPVAVTWLGAEVDMIQLNA